VEQVGTGYFTIMSERGRRFMITDNGVGGAEPTILHFVQGLIDGRGTPGNLRYFIGQPERGEQGRLHHQCYCEFTTATRFEAVKRYFGLNHLHVEAARTQEEAIAYCSKEDTRVGPCISWGTPAVAGRKRPCQDDALRQVHDDYITGTSLNESFYKHPKAFIAYQRVAPMLSAERHRDAPYFRRVRAEAWIGPPGTRKTSTAYSEAPNLYRPPLRTSESGSIWFDGYQGQDTLLLDDFEGWLPYDVLLQILDPYPLTLQIKGGTVQANFSRVILTSNKEIEEWYPNRTNWEALRRRLNIRRFN